jgi:hypothetical protein
VAVQKVKAKKQISYFLPMVERQLILPFVMTVLGGENFKGAKGDTANIKVTEPSIATARDYDFRGRTGPIVLDDIYQSGGSIPIKLTTHVVSATGLEDEHFTLDDLGFATEVLSPQVESVVSRVESKALAGFRALHPKHTLTVAASDDPHLVATESKRLMDGDKVAPFSGRVFLVGTDIAAAWLASQRLTEANLSDSVTPALRDAVIGRLSGSPVVVPQRSRRGRGLLHALERSGPGLCRPGRPARCGYRQRRCGQARHRRSLAPGLRRELPA